MPGSEPQPGYAAAAQAQPNRGQDIEHPITLTFEQAALGVILPLQINRAGTMETVEAKVPAGVMDGSRIRLRGLGEQVPGGEPGDIFIVTIVTPHPWFRRERLDVLMDLPLSLYEAMLGTKVQIPTLYGSVTVTVPPGMSSGTRLRIKDHGVERAGEKGHHVAIVKIILPTSVSEQDRLTLLRIAERNPVSAREHLSW